MSVADNPLLTSSGQNFRLTCTLTNGSAEVDELFISATYFPSSYEPLGFSLPPFDTPPQQ